MFGVCSDSSWHNVICHLVNQEQPATQQKTTDSGRNTEQPKHPKWWVKTAHRRKAFLLIGFSSPSLVEWLSWYSSIAFLHSSYSFSHMTSNCAVSLSLSLSVSVIRMLDSVTVSQSVSILKLLRTKGQSTIHLLLKVLQWKIIGILGKNSPSWIGEKGHRRTRSQAYHNRIPGNLWGEQYK